MAIGCRGALSAVAGSGATEIRLRWHAPPLVETRTAVCSTWIA